MPQVFHPAWNTLSRVSIPAAFGLVVGILWLLGVWYRSDYTTRRHIAPPQPVPFSHRHHAGELGLDCRLCHQTVETEAFAGMPATSVCTTCHRQIWTTAEMLAPVRQSAISGEPLRWRRVHDLADYVYFHHGVHVSQGIGCSTCHGRVHEMALTRQAEAMHMKWCLDCHREPERFLRPHDEVLNMEWTPPPDQLEQGRRLVAEYGIDVERLDECWICHR